MHSAGSLARNPRWKQVLLKLAQDLKVCQLRKGYFVEDFILDFFVFDFQSSELDPSNNCISLLLSSMCDEWIL